MEAADVVSHWRLHALGAPVLEVPRARLCVQPVVRIHLLLLLTLIVLGGEFFVAVLIGVVLFSQV